MTKYYAQVDGGVVVSVLQAHAEITAPDMIELEQYDPAIIGSTYTGGEFIPAPLPTWDDVTPEYWWVEVGSFYDRFGSAKIAVLASPDPTVQALVRDTQVRKYIDLQRPDVVQFVGYLGTAVDEVTPEIQAAVLGPPTTEDERYIKGLPQPIDPET